MSNAVIYARYSSIGQNEQSIEGQLRICKEFAESKGFNIVKTYTDKARSAWKEDARRPDFDQMIADAPSGMFQHIIVYKFDRFVRGRAKSISLKKRLMDSFGIRVSSATEPVSDDEGGEIYEMFLEWNDEKYSQRLSKRVRDGLTTSVANGTFCGGTLIYGYKIRKEQVGNKDRYIKYVEIDNEQAEVIRFIFKEYARGVSKQNIAVALNEQGHRYFDKPFKARTFDKWLTNEKYTGCFSFGGRKCDNMFPQIINRDIFDKAQKLLQKNKYFKKSNTVREPFLLNSKLYCGHCGAALVADGGVGHLGVTYKYYTCKQTKKCLCDKCRENKNDLEKWVAEETVKFFKDPKRINKVADDLINYYNKKTDESEIKAIETKIVVTKKQIDDTLNSMIAAESMATKKLLDKKINDLSVLVEDLELQKTGLELERGLPITKQSILDFIAEFTDGDPMDKQFQKHIIDNLVMTIYAYDDHSVIYFSVGSRSDTSIISKKETDEILQKRAEPAGSTLDDIGGEGGI